MGFRREGHGGGRATPSPRSCSWNHRIFGPVFPAGIGLRFGLRAFSDGCTFLLAVLVLLIGIVTKIVGRGIAALKHGRPVALRVSFGLIRRGEFCFVVAQVGMGLKAVPSDTYGIVVFVAVAATPAISREVLSTDNKGEGAVPFIQPG